MLKKLLVTTGVLMTFLVAATPDLHQTRRL